MGDQDDKKKQYSSKDFSYGKKGRQLHQHGAKPTKEGDDKKPMDKDNGKDCEKEGDYKKDEGKKDGDYKKDDGKDKKDVEPSAEFKAAAKACSENKLCKQLMECMKKHA